MICSGPGPFLPRALHGDRCGLCTRLRYFDVIDTIRDLGVSSTQAEDDGLAGGTGWPPSVRDGVVADYNDRCSPSLKAKGWSSAASRQAA